MLNENLDCFKFINDSVYVDSWHEEAVSIVDNFSKNFPTYQKNSNRNNNDNFIISYVPTQDSIIKSWKMIISEKLKHIGENISDKHSSTKSIDYDVTLQLINH